MKWKIALIVVVLVCNCYQNSTSDDWPMFQHDPQHTGFSPEPITVPLKELWKHETYGHIESEIAFDAGYEGIYTKCIISEERIYILLHPATIFSLDLNIGTLLWSIQTDKTDTVWWSFPAVSEKKIFASLGNGIICLDSGTGDTVWEHEVKSIEFMSSPIVHDKYVYVGSGETGADISSPIWNQAKKIYCFHADTGGLIWEFESDYIVNTSPVYWDGHIFINGGNRTVYSLDAHTGQLIWKRELEKSLTSSVSTDGERLFVGDCAGMVSCLELETGKILWRVDCRDSIYGTPAVAYGNMYIGTLGGTVYCVDSEYGDLIWTIETGSSIMASPVITDGKVIFGTEDGELYVADSESGNILDFHDLGGSGICALAVSTQTLVVGQENGRITLFSGSSQWSIPIVVVITTVVVLLSGVFAYHRMRKRKKNFKNESMM